jgi:aspartyl-tRNA(Asn)/glutamyl-tRNA(Gln) amidotransferase subunit A
VTIWITQVQQTQAGIRLAVKDSFDTGGLLTTYGSSLFAEHVPARTATAVLRLCRAGYVVAGKANLHELGLGATSENPHFGTVPNPLATGRTAGGSSGGCAAALAVGLADAALGSDTGGSIRIPAACCGVVGLKPTHGLVPVDGLFPCAPSFDSVGPMARDAVGCAHMLASMVPGAQPEPIPSLEDLSVGVAWLDRADPLVRLRVTEAARRFRRTRRVDLPAPHACLPLFQWEIACTHWDLFARGRHGYGPDVASKIEAALRVTDREAAKAARALERLRCDALAVIDGLDLVLTPTLPCVAPPSGPGEDPIRRELLTRFTMTASLLGWPALAIPCGSAEFGLPASVQLIGRPGDDMRLLAVAQALAAGARPELEEENTDAR